MSQALVERILDGALSPGFSVAEEDLKDTFTVSRVTARSAIAELTTRRYLTKEPNKAARVTALSKASVLDLFRVRRPIELEAVRLIMKTGTDAELDPAVDDAIDALEHARDEPPHIAIPLNLQFHKLLIGSSNNAWLMPAFESLEAGLQLALAQTKRVPNAQQAAHEHRSIVQTIRNGKWEDARDQLIKHLKASEKTVAEGI